jgi:hypothetical protein
VIYLLCVLLGMAAGAGAVYAVMRRMRAGEKGVIPLDGVRWEKTGGGIVATAIRHMRRYYPTHELVIGCPFSEFVEAKGASAEAVRRRCAAWTVGVCMVDRRTAVVSRIVLWACDADAEEKSWILKRAGYRVTVIDRHIEESGLVEAMAA